jgi:hypothetical protein
MQSPYSGILSAQCADQSQADIKREKDLTLWGHMLNW